MGVNRERWTMDVSLTCGVTPPPDVLRRALDEVGAAGAAVRSEGGRRLITFEAQAVDASTANESLNRSARELVSRLARYDCQIERTDALQRRTGPEDPPQTGSLMP